MKSSRAGTRDRALRPGLESLEGRTLLTSTIDGLVEVLGAPSEVAPAADFDGDGKTDLAVFRPATAQWFVRRSTEGPWSPAPAFGAATLIDIPVPGDYDGDGHVEPAVFRVATAEWFVQGPNGGYRLASFGATNLMDIPVPADYDGDGKTDLAVFRHSTGQWFMLSPTGSVSLGSFGATNLMDLPVPADYDGDGRAEPAVFRVGTAEWFARGSSGTVQLGRFGATNLMDIPVPGDYDGDGRAEPAVFRLGTAEWFARWPTGSHSLGRYGGINGYDLPVAAPIAALARMGIKYYASVSGPPIVFNASYLSQADVPFRRLDLGGSALHEAQVAQARTGTNPVVLLGDSIFGWWSTPATGNVGRASWNDFLAPVGAANLGIAGDMTQNLLWRVQNGALDGRPRLAVIEIGTNNLAAGYDVNATVRGIAAVVSAIQAVSPSTEILILGVLPRARDPRDPIRAKVADLNARFTGLVSGTTVRFLDPTPFFLQADGLLRPNLLPDELHPNDQGYLVLAQLLRNTIDAMLLN